MLIFGILAVVFVAGFYLMLRNSAVHRFRLGLIAKVSQAAQADITAGDFNWQWRYTAFESVSYDRMILSVRRLRPENYYADTAFLEARDA